MHFDASILEHLLGFVLFVIIAFFALILFALYRYQKGKELERQKDKNKTIVEVISK